MKRYPRKKVVERETVHGYRGNATTCYKLSCGHERRKTGYQFKNPKTMECLECGKPEDERMLGTWLEDVDFEK